MARAPRKLRTSLVPVGVTPELLLSRCQGLAKPGKLSPTPELPLGIVFVMFLFLLQTAGPASMPASLFGGAQVP